MKGSDRQSDFFKRSERYLSMIQDENKMVRRNGLRVVCSELQAMFGKDKAHVSVGSGDDGSGDHLELLYSLLRPVVVLIKDPMERTREAAYELIEIFVRSIPKAKVKELLPTLIPIMVERLGQPELNEPSEEIRLLAIKRIDDLLKKLGTDLNPFVDDIIQILASGITDPFQAVRVASCEVASRVADVCRTVFHYNSDRLLRPLCTSISHQLHRVRIATVKCIRQVVLLGNHKGVEAVLPYVTQRVFDPIPGVRLAVAETVGVWMVEYIDRYSYFPKFLPLLLSLMDDENPEIREKVHLLWDAAGSKYMTENIEQYRDEIDFPTPQPEHYPPNVVRPNLGCRLITWHSVPKLLPALPAETSDWIPTTRIKATQLLYYIILISEEKITMHVGNIFPIICKTIRDDEPLVSTYAEKAAEAIGYFIPLKVTWPILSSTISTGASERNLAVLKAILRGTDPLVLCDFVPEILDLLSDSEVLETRNKRKHTIILSICETLLQLVPKKLCEKEMAKAMFRVVLITWAQCQDLELGRFAKEIMEKLGSNLGLDLNELIGEFSAHILEEMKNKRTEWTLASRDRLIFDLILSIGGLTIDSNMDTILEIMLTNLNPEKDPEVRLKFFTSLARHLEFYSKTGTTHQKELQKFVKHIIEDVLDPNLIWKAGKTAGVLRTAAASCLMSILDSGILDPNVLASMAPKTIESIIGIVDDSSETTRILSCECLRNLVIRSKGGLGADILHKIYPVMLKRLDDVSNTVRIGALNTIAAVFTNLPIDYDITHYQPYVEHAYTTLILHLDDSDQEIQDKVQSVLHEIGHLCPKTLVSECEKVKTKHRLPNRCEDLIKTFQALDIMIPIEKDL